MDDEIRELKAEVASLRQGVERLAFRFDALLDSPEFHWLQFEWPTWSYKPFNVPAIGQTVTLTGPRR